MVSVRGSEHRLGSQPVVQTWGWRKPGQEERAALWDVRTRLYSGQNPETPGRCLDGLGAASPGLRRARW